MKTFKSPRAAKMAYTKAENAYWEARIYENNLRHTIYSSRGVPSHSDETDPDRTALNNAEAYRKVAFENAMAVYEAAIAQGFWVPSMRAIHPLT